MSYNELIKLLHRNIFGGIDIKQEYAIIVLYITLMKRF